MKLKNETKKGDNKLITISLIGLCVKIAYKRPGTNANPIEIQLGAIIFTYFVLHIYRVSEKI